MKKLLSIVFILSLFVLLGCNSDKSNIRKVASSFFTALDHKNIPAAKAYATKESAAFLDLMQQQITSTNTGNSSMDEKFLVSDIQIKDSAATANIRSETQKTPLHITMLKENGEWKVAFDKNTIMEMALDMSKNGKVDSSAAPQPGADIQMGTPHMDNQQEPTRRDTQVLQLPQ